ncbi:MAG: thiamine pyrophosphate-binding protein [Rhodospirillales bacterium]|nr:thiamine pyrophosphate-binding protein [Rhodospirillales bacterium]
MPKTADIIARRLYAAGCRHVFGIPGGEVLALMDGCKKAGMEFVLVKHENPGGFMAEGTHHFTKAPCVLLATVGPGVANAVNAIVNAYQDQVPLIYLTGCYDADTVQTYSHQIFDHGELLKSVTKASFTMVDGAIDVIIDKAISVAMDGKPGPVHIDVPISVATREQGTVPVRRVTPARSGPVAGPELEAARSLFAAARKPLVIAGVEVLHQDCAGDVAAFCLKFKIPLLTTYKGKGILAEDHALALGGVGLSPKADEIIQPLVADSDLVVLAGYDPIEMRSSWVNLWDADKNVIEFSQSANSHYVHQAKLNFIGDIGAGLAALSEGVPAKPVWPDKQPAAVRARHKTAFAGDGQWGAAAVVAAARRALPRHTIAAVDTGAHRILLSQAWECYEPRGLMQSTGLCTMGVALPLAMGRKLAEPERPVVAFSGDAGLEMILGELATARDLKISLPVVVFVDRQLALIELKQRGSAYDNLGVDFGGTDFAAVAAAMGGVGVTAASEPELESALLAALDRDTFTVIACPIGRKAYDGKI